MIIKSLNINKAKDPDGISDKFVKISADIIECHIANIINEDIYDNNPSSTGIFWKIGILEKQKTQL